MNKDKLLEMYNTYELSKEDFFKHQHYTIITRQGIDKIQAKAKIQINYEVIRCEPNYAVFKAIASKGAANIETFGSALKGDTYKDSTTNSFYIAEMAEKRAMSRAVLKLTGFYELGVFGEDESESFKRKQMYEESECCGADRWYYTDLCSECKENTEFKEVE